VNPHLLQRYPLASRRNIGSLALLHYGAVPQHNPVVFSIVRAKSCLQERLAHQGKRDDKVMRLTGALGKAGTGDGTAFSAGAPFPSGPDPAFWPNDKVSVWFHAVWKSR
jgi:hypothetical protein